MFRLLLDRTGIDRRRSATTKKFRTLGRWDLGGAIRATLGDLWAPRGKTKRPRKECESVCGPPGAVYPSRPRRGLRHGASPEAVAKWNVRRVSCALGTCTPGVLPLAIGNLHAHYLSFAKFTHGVRHQRRLAHHVLAVAYFEIHGVQPHVRIGAVQLAHSRIADRKYPRRGSPRGSPIGGPSNLRWPSRPASLSV
jgi:hypothetical protein